MGVWRSRPGGGSANVACSPTGVRRADDDGKGSHEICYVSKQAPNNDEEW